MLNQPKGFVRKLFYLLNRSIYACGARNGQDQNCIKINSNRPHSNDSLPRKESDLEDVELGMDSSNLILKDGRLRFGRIGRLFS